MKTPEEDLLRSVAMQSADRIRKDRQRAEEALTRAREELQAKTEQLAESLSLMQATLESTADGILVTDAEGHIKAYNERYLQIWKLPPGLLQTAGAERIQEEISRKVANPGELLRRNKEIYAAAPVDTFDTLELLDGALIERHSRVQLVSGKSVGRVWSFRDVTESRRAGDALREERHILEVLNRTGAILSSQLSLEVVVQTVTDAATELSGAKFGTFFYNTVAENGESCMLYTSSGAPREAFEKFGEPCSTASFPLNFKGEGVIRCDDVLNDPRYGNLPPYGMPAGDLPVRSYLAVPVVSRSEEVIGGLFFGHPEPDRFTQKIETLIVGVAAQAAVAIDNAHLYQAAQRSAEERKKLLESERLARGLAERASKMKDEFLAILSHELRTPLSAILGWSQMLKHGVKDEAIMHTALDTIERNARSQTQLIEDLLDMSRITSGKVRLDIQPVAPISFVEGAIATMLHAAKAKEIRLQRFLDPAAGPISGDPNRLQQVVWNLLSNAIKFTPKGGRVQVTLERVNTHIEISVSDTGLGIRPEFLPFVFDRFRQADSSATRSHGGLGLGLAIVKSLVELHGGSVRVESAGEGRGSTFTLYFPLLHLRTRGNETGRLHAATPVNAPAFEKVDLSGVNVLVVDDEADARDLLTHILKMCGANVFSAGDASEALELVRNGRPDVIVCDIGMPHVDGFELLRRVRALGEAAGGRVPAIALTAFARAEDRTRVLRAGFLVHVAKPVDPSEIVATVASVAARS